MGFAKSDHYTAETMAVTSPCATSTVPDDYICPLTLEMMHDPVISKYGNSFERHAIITWLGALGNTTCPLTRRPLRLSDLITNHKLKAALRQYRLDHADNAEPEGYSSTSSDTRVCGFFAINAAENDDTERTWPDDDDDDDEPAVQAVSVPTAPPPAPRSNGLWSSLSSLWPRGGHRSESPVTPASTAEE
jgi:U-box domain